MHVDNRMGVSSVHVRFALIHRISTINAPAPLLFHLPIARPDAVEIRDRTQVSIDQSYEYPAKHISDGLPFL